MNLDRTVQNTDVDVVQLDLPGLLDPTNDTYGSFYVAYEFFNAALFDGALPGCLFTMQRRRRRSRGYFSYSRFNHRRDGEEIVDEIALNPQTFSDRSDREIISTAVHEMVHQWQFHFGKPSRRGYHNKEWAAKMVEVGLIPSHTGEPGGKQTGQAVTDYIERGGSYDTKWRELEATSVRLDYEDREALRPEKPRKEKYCYICPRCGLHMWGKSGVIDLIIHGGCSERML